MIPFNSSYMETALSPRDATGHIVPMVFPGGLGPNGTPLFWPFIPPRADGKDSPMLFETDFSPGGQHYHNLSYFPGFYAGPLGVMDDGTETFALPGDVVFSDPRLNMSRFVSAVNQQGLLPGMLPIANSVMTALGNCGAVSSASQGLPDLENPKGALLLKNQKNIIVPICNSDLKVTSLRKILNGSSTSFEVCLQILRHDVEVSVPESNLENLAAFISEKYPWFHLNAETPNAAVLLTSFIRDQLDTVPEITVAKQSGWILHEGKHIYVHDGLGNVYNFLCETGCTIPFDSAMSPAAAFSSMMNILDIGCHAVTLPLLLTSIGGTLAALFEDAGLSPRFCTFLYGLSGSLKTATAEVFCNFYGTRDHSTFRDTPAAIDVNIGKHRDRTLLVDDFQPPVVASMGKDMTKTLEHIIRLFGDSIAKHRSNSTATATHGVRPRGACIITGESISGSYSSLLRCLLVPITREDINGTLLRRFQNTPEYWSSNFVHFLWWIGENWDSLIAKIKTRFPLLRTFFAQATGEPRLVDNGAFLLLTGEILLDYGKNCGAIDSATCDKYLSEWQMILYKAVDFSSSLAGDVDLVSLCKVSLKSAHEAGSLKIAATVDDFQPGMDGFLSPNRLWLRSEALLREMRKKSTEMSASCTLSTKTVLPELYRRGLILRDEEKEKNSFLKRTPLIPALGRRSRFICFLLEELSS